MSSSNTTSSTLPTFADRDIVVTAVTRTQLPPLSPHVLPIPSHPLPLTSNEATPHEHMRDALCHVTRTSSGCEHDNTKRECTTSCIPPSTQIKPKAIQQESGDNEREDNGKG